MAIQLKEINNKTDAFWYTPVGQEDDESPTQFKLMPLDGLQYVDILAEIHTDKDGNTSLSATGVRLAIKHGLVGAKNLINSKGKEVAFNAGTARGLDSSVLVELANKIIESSNIEAEEAKN